MAFDQRRWTSSPCTNRLTINNYYSNFHNNREKRCYKRFNRNYCPSFSPCHADAQVYYSHPVSQSYVKRIDKALVEGTTRPVLDSFPKRVRHHVTVQHVDFIDWSQNNQRRCGVVLKAFDSVDNEYKYILGVDKESGDLTDLGGSLNCCDNRDVRLCAIRECYEETLDLVDVSEYILTNTKNTIASFTHKEILFIVTLDIDIRNLLKLFDERRSNRKWVEVDRLVVKTREELEVLMDKENKDTNTTEVIYEKTSRLLGPALRFKL